MQPPAPAGRVRVRQRNAAAAGEAECAEQPTAASTQQPWRFDVSLAGERMLCAGAAAGVSMGGAVRRDWASSKADCQMGTWELPANCSSHGQCSSTDVPVWSAEAGGATHYLVECVACFGFVATSLTARRSLSAPPSWCTALLIGLGMHSFATIRCRRFCLKSSCLQM
eukprot:6213967-Pleurochrysis_carterae.AAC.4